MAKMFISNITGLCNKTNSSFWSVSYYQAMYMYLYINTNTVVLIAYVFTMY